MFLKIPQNTEKVFWTTHSKIKMRQYGFSEKRVLRILRKPDRKEEGIAPRTIAAMQITGTKKYPTESWMMYHIISSKIKGRALRSRSRQEMRQSINDHQNLKLRKIRIISAWRYPGRTLEGERPIIPEDTLHFLQSEK